MASVIFRGEGARMGFTGVNAGLRGESGMSGYGPRDGICVLVKIWVSILHSSFTRYISLLICIFSHLSKNNNNKYFTGSP